MVEESENKDTRTGLEIAVIGMSGRFPGAGTVSEFWENLKNGVESISFFSDRELGESGVEPEILEDPHFVRGRGIIDNVEYLDADFFDYTPQEAEIMDPQMRVFHECSWEALEDAGYAPESYKGRIGVYGGASSGYYWLELARFSRSADLMGNIASVTLYNKDFLCKRISYNFNLTGPSFSLYTACSTSLAATDLACKGLLTGQCDIALAGGVSVKDPRKVGYYYGEGMIVSPDGHNRTFDSHAGGTVFGNGAAVVVLKPLEEAEADGDSIYAVIKSSAVNNDGINKSNFAAPGLEGQAGVIRAALHMAEVPPESIGYIEAHGTATEVGDPIEIEGLKRAFNTDKKGFCAIGSVKSNMGHLDCASGVTGLIKVALALNHKLIPPNLHFESPNPGIDFENSPFYVNAGLKEWRNNGYPLRAGVSSFGIGGTNVHVILEERPVTPDPQRTDAGTGREHQLILLSAKTGTALRQVSQNLVNYLEKNPGINLADVAYTLQTGRTAFDHRQYLVCSTVEKTVAALTAPGSASANVNTVFMKDDEKPVIFMFPGQGSQYVNMGLGLYETERVFREETDRCFEILNSMTGYDLKRMLYPTIPGSRQEEIDPIPDDPSIAQPILFIFEYALAKLLIHWGIEPHAMIGYSLGEYTAACISGVLSLENALKIIVTRGELIQKIPTGVMLSVPLRREELIPFLNSDVHSNHRLSLAIDNGPSCIVAGPGEAVDAFEKKMKEKRMLCMRVPVAHAFHSRMMEPVLQEFAAAIGHLPGNKPGIPYISNVSGTWITPEQTADPAYWVTHLKETVRFADGLEELIKKPDSIFIEVGPGRDLTALVSRYIEENPNQHVLDVVRGESRKISDAYYLLNRIGLMWLYGIKIDWPAFCAEEKRRRVHLPTYPFERQRYMIEGGSFNRGIGIPREHIDHWARREPPEDDKALREESHVYSQPRRPRPHLLTPYVPPQKEPEQTLVDIWQTLFGFEGLGIQDDFIELGGDSLKAVQVITTVHKALNVSVPLADFFKEPTIRWLADYIANAEKNTYQSITPGEKKKYYPLSSAQKRLFILHQIDRETLGYNLTFTTLLEGEIDRVRLNKSFLQLIERHESLRTSFHLINGQPVQRVHDDDEVEFEIEYYDLTAGNSGESVTDLVSTFVHPFALSQAPLIRVGLIKVEEENHVMIVDIHHIIYDGTSHVIFLEEFFALYAGEELPALKNQYKEYAQWQNRGLKREAVNKQEKYWLEEFKGEIPLLELPTDYARPAVQSQAGSVLSFDIGIEETNALRQLVVKEDATLFIVLLSVYNTLLSKLSGQDDIVVGTPVAGRRHPDLQPMIGIFLNTLALRNFPAADKSFGALLKEVKEKTLTAFDNQDYPFEDLVERSAVKRDLSRNPLFDVMFILHTQLQSQPTEIQIRKTAAEAKDLNLKPYQYEKRTSEFDLTLIGFERENHLHFRVEYCTKLFKKERIQRFISYLKKTVSSILKSLEQKLFEIEIISGQEKNQLLYEFNNTKTGYPNDRTIHQLFEEQAGRTPDGVAVVGSKKNDGQTAITYRELNERANRLAFLLRTKGAAPGTIVGIKVKRSLEMMIGLLGILKAGAAYLPIDPDYPDQRIDYVLSNSDTTLLVTAGIFDNIYRSYMSYKSYGTKKQSTARSAITQPVARLAYVIYTSGSTGNPKGVMIRHQNAVNFITGMTSRIDFSPGKTILALTTISFDIFFLETLLPITCGLKVVIADEEQQKNPQLLEEVILSHYVDMVQFTPSRLQLLLNMGDDLICLERVEELIVGGEAFPVRLFEEVKEKFRGKIYNVYGPTETTIWSTVKDLTHSRPGELTIGKPIANTQVYIIDRFKRLQPPGVAGELLIGGDGVAAGYLNNVRLTAEKFILLQRTKSLLSHEGHVNMSSMSYLSHLYRTGDLARWLANGELEFLGRIDHQVKIRGFRVELEEIEEQLLKQENIRDAVVVMKTSKTGDKSLCAYIVTGPAGFDTSELREILSVKLPHYMIPSYFVPLEKIPLTPNGKIDRKSLPDPDSSRKMREATYVAPGSDNEKIIADLWKEVLQVDEVGIHDNFFDLGGNSLNVIRLNWELKERFGEEIPVAAMFRNLTVSYLDRYLNGEGPSHSEVYDHEKEIKQTEALDRAKITYKNTIDKFTSNRRTT